LLQDLVVTPDGEQQQGQLIGRIGVYPKLAPIPERLKRLRTFSVDEAIVYGFEKSFSQASLVLLSIKKLVVGEISTKNLSGPIGIAKVAGDSARAGFIYYLGFLAQLSVYLAVLNLLPIPVLDGGHIVYCLLEAAKGSPVSEKLKLYSAQIGLALLGCVMIVAFYNDILRL
jgi:regulator of sigma E protease